MKALGTSKAVKRMKSDKKKCNLRIIENCVGR